MVNMQMGFAHRFDHREVNDQPTACGRRGQAFSGRSQIQRVAKTSKTMSKNSTPAGRTAS